MNYSQKWQDKLNFYNGLRQTMDWETFIDTKYVDLNRWMATDIVFLDNPVWVEIHHLIGHSPFRKIKAVSKYDVYFDGAYDKLSQSCSLGCINTWTYTIDGHTLDLTGAFVQENNQQKLIDFIKKYSDGFMPQIPKGILKIPATI